MKSNTFFLKLFIVVFLIVFYPGIHKAQNILVRNDLQTGLKVTENSYAALKLNNALAELHFTSVKTREGNFTLLTAEEYGHSMTYGEPMLPVLKQLIEVPLNATFEIKILSMVQSEISLIDYGITDFIIPAQPPLSKSIDNPEDVEFVFNQAFYAQNSYGGQNPVQVVELGTLRGVNMARVEIAPVYYNPVQNKLMVISDIEVQIVFNGGNIEATVQQKADKYSPFYMPIHQQLINFKPLEGKELITEVPATYIIVSDPMFQSALQPFIEWKIKKGFRVVEAYTNEPGVGNTNASIKNYLQSFYNNPPLGYNPQSFVLIVGDVAQIPAYSGSATVSYHHSDLYYFTYDGAGDIYPDCYYGRFSANNLAELQPQIDKTLQYEKYLFPDATFLDEVVMVAGADGTYGQLHGNGQINYGTNYYFNAAHGLTSHTYLQPEPGGGNYSQSIRQNINNGVAFGNYTAHCSTNGWADPSFTIGHISQLTNVNKYPLLIGNCCSSVEFQVTCFGEEIVRAANKGALGYIGGSNSTYWNEDFWWGVGFKTVSVNPVYSASSLGAYDRWFHDHNEPLSEWYVTQGQISPAGNLAVTQSGSNLNTYYWEIYHLMGDPSLMIYFSQPAETIATYQGLMPLGSATFTVNTVPYAYVAISKDGTLHGCALSNAAGLAEITLFNPILVPGVADIVITGQNVKPFFGTVTVASPDGAYVLFNELTINDAAGNNNGIIDFGEYILLDVTLENFGNLPASNVTATLTTADPHITINVGTHNWPNIPAGSTMLQSQAFAFTVANVIPDQHKVLFNMSITDGNDTWNSTFYLTLNAPVLIIGSYTIDDSDGNGNGRLDPGETALIIIQNSNDGGSNAVNTTATAISMSPLLTINNATYNLATLASGQTASAIFSVTVHSAAQPGEVVSMVYSLVSPPYSETQNISMTIGLMVEDFESGTFGNYPWEFGGDAPWTITNVNPYEGVYSAKSGVINHNQSSALSVTVDVSTYDQISFFYKVSSENNYDYLKFYINGSVAGQWSGEAGWSEASYPVSPGLNTFKWEYVKDYSVVAGQDCAWIDYIVFPAFAGQFPLAVVTSVNPGTICQGESAQLHAYAMGGTGSYTYEWLPVTGLSNPAIANPVATPDVTTTYYVVVNDGDNIVSDQVTLTVNPSPAKPVITQAGNMLISSAPYGNQWYNTTGMIEGATSQSFTPTMTDHYHVIVTSFNNCISDPSDPYYFIFTGVTEFTQDQKVNVYPNPFSDSFTLDYNLSSNSMVKISLFNSYGQQMTVIEEDISKPAGNYKVHFDASRFTTGVYFIKLETSESIVMKRIIRSK
jgi:hypothetical protein